MLIINTKLIEYIYGYGWTGNRKETRGRTSRLRMKSFISIWKVWEMAPVIFQLALASVFALRIVLETWRHAQVKTRWTITLWVALQVILYLKLVSICWDLSGTDERDPHLISARQKSVGEVHFQYIVCRKTLPICLFPGSRIPLLLRNNIFLYSYCGWEIRLITEISYFLRLIFPAYYICLKYLQTIYICCKIYI